MAVDRWVPEGAATSARRLGVFGGSFDPIHLGHLIVAEEAREHLSLDHVLFVPARVSPLKRHASCFPGEDRYRMVELAVADHPSFSACRLDLDREGMSFTVDTLAALREMIPQAQLFFIMGADSLESLSQWRRPDAIIRLARIVALGRPGYELDITALDRELPGLAAATDRIDTIEVGISSTDIRNRLRLGRSVRYLVPSCVAMYMVEHQHCLGPDVEIGPPC